jgi:hypothetical protein
MSPTPGTEKAQPGHKPRSDVIGWLMWNTMRLAAALGLALFSLTLILFVWFMFDVGFAWLGLLVIGLAVLILFFSVRNLRTGFDIRR